jgi:hypothetical protein
MMHAYSNIYPTVEINRGIVHLSEYGTISGGVNVVGNLEE